MTTETKRIHISDQISLALAVIMAFWAFAVLAMKADRVIFGADLALAAGFAAVPRLNRTSWRRLSRNLLVTMTNGTLFLFPALFGRNSGTHFCFFPATAIPFALFGPREIPSLLYGVGLPMALFSVLQLTDFSVVPHYGELPAGTWIFWLTVACAFILSFLPIFLFSRANEKAEAELRVSEKKYSSIVELAREGIWVTDSAARTLYMNPAMLEILGETSESIRGKTIFDFVDEAGKTLTLERMRRRSQGITDRFEFRMHRRDGKAIDALVSASPVTDRDGNHTSTIAVVLDVTEAKARDAQMLSAAKLSSLGEMAAGIAHEINNPLMALNLKIGLLEHQLSHPTEGSEQTTRLIGEMKAVIRRASKIIEGLRFFSREDRGEAPRAVAVRDLLEDTLSFCRERFLANGVELVSPAVPQTLKVRCRPVQLSQVLLNLLNNAFDAVQESRLKRIEIEVARKGARVEISVADTGPGVAPELRERIFEPFFTTKPVGKGTGLGLSISKGILEAQDGTLAYAPGPGGMGSRFHFEIPAAAGGAS